MTNPYIESDNPPHSAEYAPNDNPGDEVTYTTEEEVAASVTEEPAAPEETTPAEPEEG